MHRSVARPFLPSSLTGALPVGPHCIAGLHCRSVRSLDEGWEFRPGPAAGIWGIWRADESDLWTLLTPLTHRHAASGLTIYRARFHLRNPLLNGRTILHFHASAHSATLWVGPILIGSRDHTPGDFVFDITDALARLAPSEARQGIPIAVLCDNSAGQSASSAFRAALAYLPALALDTVAIRPVVSANGSTRISVQAALYNPNDRSSSCTASIQLLDPAGNLLATATETVEIWRGLRQLATFRLPTPVRQSAAAYSCRVTLSSPAGQTHIEESFTLRPAKSSQPAKRLLLHLPRRTGSPHDHATQASALSWA